MKLKSLSPSEISEKNKPMESLELSTKARPVFCVSPDGTHCTLVENEVDNELEVGPDGLTHEWKLAICEKCSQKKILGKRYMYVFGCVTLFGQLLGLPKQLLFPVPFQTRPPTRRLSCASARFFPEEPGGSTSQTGQQENGSGHARGGQGAEGPGTSVRLPVFRESVSALRHHFPGKAESTRASQETQRPSRGDFFQENYPQKELTKEPQEGFSKEEPPEKTTTVRRQGGFGPRRKRRRRQPGCRQQQFRRTN